MRAHAGPNHAVGYASPVRAHAEPRTPTPAEHAHDAITRAAREVDAVERGIEILRRAHADNDPARWHEERDVLVRRLAEAERCVDAARRRDGDAAPEAKERLATTERALAASKATIEASTEAPRGWNPISRDDEVLAILDAPRTGSARATFEQKEMALKAVLAQLSAAESRVLAERIEKGRANDPIATRFARLVPERRHRLLAFLGGARRREAIQTARQPAVQLKSGAPAAGLANAAAVASEGVAGASSALPHGEQIQPAFGRHDISGVRAQIGGPAATASQALSARAYAIGDRVAFASSPDLHTAAHEAAHVVQQRRGVQLAGGVGHADDPYERAADEVADAVVAGRSAESLLDRHASTAGEHRAVQRKADPQQQSIPAWEYLKVNNGKFVDAIQRRVARIAVPTHERLVWVVGGLGIAFPEALYSALAGDVLFSKLPELAYPVDPWYVIDENRALTDGTPGVAGNGKEPLGPGAWEPIAGEALAIALATVVRDSLARMAARYVIQLEDKRSVTVADLVASHPMDRVTARLLVDERVVRPVAAKHGAKRTRSPSDPLQFRDGVRFLSDWHWVDDPALWNWIEVVDPRDATVEDVAATLWADPDQSQRAYGITSAAPFFRIDPRWARMFEPAKSRAPQGFDQPHEDNALVLAESARATDIAIAQVAGERKRDKHGVPLPPDLDRLGTVLDQSWRQLERAAETLNGSPLRPLVYPAYHWGRSLPRALARDLRREARRAHAGDRRSAGGAV